MCATEWPLLPLLPDDAVLDAGAEGGVWMSGGATALAGPASAAAAAAAALKGPAVSCSNGVSAAGFWGMDL